MPGFEDSAIIVLLALLLFGPKKLPELARQFGKLMADFRRASSEFRTQMEDELRLSEQAERQKQLAATSAATPAIDPAKAAEVPGTYPDQDSPSIESSHESSLDSGPESTPDLPSDATSEYPDVYSTDSTLTPSLESTTHSTPEAEPPAPPIAISGDLTIQPPSTGLPTPHSASADLSATTQAQQDERHTEALHG